ncbi:MAG: threonine/serine exporter [Clostridia bacterium]|nr:threonine/serine exporter [Clostridia bacterium]
MIIFETAAAFVASFMIAVNCDVSRSELVLCGLGGLTAKGVYQMAVYNSGGEVFAVLVSAASVTALARTLANIRRMPVTTYLIAGIIPLVPGAGMYNTVFNIIASDYITAMLIGFDTVKAAAAIAIGIIIIFALPNKIFFKLKRNK